MMTSYRSVASLVMALGLAACQRSEPVAPATPTTAAASPAPVETPPAAAPAPAAPAAAAAPTPAPAAASLTVESPAREAILAAGDAAPRFRAVTHEGTAVASDGAARPRALVVYFYPRDETPGCTREACAFRDAFRAYDEAGADIVGVSTDDAAAHQAFARTHRLPFGLIADTQAQLARAFGLPGSPGGFLPRTTFVIGRDGRVARVFPGVRVDGHADEVLAAVRAAR